MYVETERLVGAACEELYAGAWPTCRGKLACEVGEADLSALERACSEAQNLLEGARQDAWLEGNAALEELLEAVLRLTTMAGALATKVKELRSDATIADKERVAAEKQRRAAA